MSRNLCRTDCAICYAYSESITLEEDPRPIAVEDCYQTYWDEYRDRMIVAKASCNNCGAKYLAWVKVGWPKSAPHRHGDSLWDREPSEDGPPFVDLSFRHAFNDEPDAEDLPTPERLAQLHQVECQKSLLNLQRAHVNDLAELAEYKRRGSHWESYRRHDIERTFKKALDDLGLGAQHRVEICDGTAKPHLFVAMATDLDGLHTGRRRYLVVCWTCSVLCHDATTGPWENVDRHLKESAR